MSKRPKGRTPPPPPRPPALTPAQATALIRRIFLEGGTFTRTDHFWSELAKAGADMGDVNCVLEYGAVLRPGQWKAQYRSYTYEVVGTDLEGCQLAVAVSIDEENFRLILITAY